MRQVRYKLKLLGSPFISILATLSFTYFMVRYWILISQHPWRYRYLLFLLRALSILCFLLLLLNPWMDWTKNTQKPQKISVIFDLSESMFNHFKDSPLQYHQIHKKIKTWGDKHTININFFQLGQKITKLGNIKSTDFNTDFRAIPDFISIEQPQQIILITDGKATIGKNINEILFSELHPIHTLGVGPVQTKQDIEIQDIILPELLARNDTVNLKIKIKSQVQDDIYSDFWIINEVGTQIYHERILFEKGNMLKDLARKIPTDIINGLNLARIGPVKGETQITNNTFSFRGNLQVLVDDLLLITGSLSQNSRLIKHLLEDIGNVNIFHFFRMERMRWNDEPLKINYSNLKLIVLDDFPLYNGDRQLFQEIVALSKEKEIPILYVQGPYGNLTSAEMIRSAYPYFVPKATDSDVLMDISTQSSFLEAFNTDLNQFPPQKRFIKWIPIENPWLAYIDESVLIGNKDSFYLISLPALAESHFKINIDSHSIITKLLQKVFLHALHKSEGFIRLDVHGKSFNKGEMVQLSINHVEGIDLKDFLVQAVNGTDTLKLNCTDEEWYESMRCSSALLLPGEYTFYAEASFLNGEKVYSNRESAIVQDVKVEMKELIQERQALMDISYKSGGTYASIDSLDTILAHIDITPVQFLKNHQISGLSIQNYWWILILLLSSEWYFRKKLGLL